MRSWGLVLHFYQPPTQSAGLTEWILRSCYVPILELLLQNPQVEMAINLSASLVLQLQAIGSHDFFSKLNILTSRGQAELLNSPIFHPIIPLTPFDIVRRQLKENRQILEKFCQVEPVPGIFPPELAVDKATLNFLKHEADFVLIDESSVKPDFDGQNLPGEYLFQFDSLKLVSTSRTLCNLVRSYPTILSSEKLLSFVKEQTMEDQTMVSVSDAEIFGHHYSERIDLLKGLFTSKEIQFKKISSLLVSESPKPMSQVIASSWQTGLEDQEAGNPFPLWQSKDNELQRKYSQLARMAYEALGSPYNTSENFRHYAEHHFDQGISSCHLYWLSNSPWWHPDLVEEGAKHLIRTIRTLPVDPEFKTKAEKFYHKFILEIWQYHWSGKVEKRYGEFEKHRQKTLESLPKL